MNAKTLDIPCPCWIVLAVSYTSELRLLLTTTSRSSHFNIATLRHSQCRFIAEHCSSQFLMPLLAATCASPSIQDAFSLPHQRDWDVKMARPTATGHWPATGPACLSPPKSSIGLDGMR